MIGFFPDPYPDELVYSICARFYDRMQYSNSFLTMQELFGCWGAKATIDLPRHLNHLISILPPGHRYTVERLIDNHTLLPFYAPFLPLERVNSIRGNMEGSNQGGIHQASGVSPSNIHPPNWLRFCPVCVEEDRKQFGESYWHRLHQLPGVEVCPNHAVFLEDSSAAARNQIHSCELVSAERAIQMTSTRSLDLSNICHTTLLKITHQAAWLLSQNDLVPSFKSLKERYFTLLTNHGLAAYYSNRVHVKKLKRAFKEYYTPSVLKLLQCEVDEDKDSNWLSCIVKDLSINKAHHPLRHLLLVQFLGCTLEEFFHLPKPLKPFGVRPWPCLNKASNHFNQLVIEECEITRNGWQTERPIGIFSCTCGFTYTRKGPDLSAEDQFRITRIKSYGSVWEATLKNLWEDSSVTWDEMARQLGVGEDAIQRNAARLELAFPRLGPRGKSIRMNDNFGQKMGSALVAGQDKLETSRSQWLSIRAENPEAGRRELKRRFSGILSWLRSNDREWLEAHLPSPGNCGGTKRYVDWEARDAKLADAVRLATLRIKSNPGRPKQVTKGAIGKDLDCTGMFRDNLNKLPLTDQVLAEVLETREKFAIRRIEWAAKCFRQENISPAWSQLVTLAGVYELRNVPQVKDAIDTALQSLEFLSSVDRWHRNLAQLTNVKPMQ